MKLTPQIIRALEDAMRRNNWTRKDVMARLEVSEATLSRWLSGSVEPGRQPQSINDDVGLKLKGLLGDAFPLETMPAKGFAPDIAIAESPPAYGRARIPRIRGGAHKLLPCLGMAQAAGWDPALEPFDDFAVGFGLEEIPIAGGKDGWFCLRVDGESLMPAVQPGALLVVAGGELPENGDLVVAKFARDGQVVCKAYRTEGDVVQLLSVNDEGKHWKWNRREEPGRLSWIYPVRDIHLSPAVVTAMARSNGNAKEHQKGSATHGK